MDTKDNFLNKVCQEIKYKPARRGIAEELELHIEDIKEDYLRSGIKENEAEEKAVAQMGHAEEIGKKLNKIHKPKLDWKLLILILILIGINFNKDFFKILMFSIISLILMLNIPSTENALILGIAYLIILTIKIMQDKEGRIIKLVSLYGIISIFSIVVICTLIVSPFRLQRIISSFNPESDPEGAGYTGMLQKEILENAKLIGEAETDIMSDEQNIINSESHFTFIFLIGKTGLLIAGILLLVIILTSIKLIINSRIIKEEYGKFLIIGISTLYILQSLATVLMNVNLGIQANIDLPFVTYGGVYLIVNLLSIALILSIYRRKDINEYDENTKRSIIGLFIEKIGAKERIKG